MTQRRRILVVDDDRQIAHAMGLRLQAAGFDVLTAHEGKSGLDIARREHPDAVVLDVRMPGMDGLTMLAQLRSGESEKDIPVVVVSANVLESTRDLAHELDASYFIEKPYKSLELVDAIRLAIEAARSPSCPDA